MNMSDYAYKRVMTFQTTLTNDNDVSDDVYRRQNDVTDVGTSTIYSVLETSGTIFSPKAPL